MVVFIAAYTFKRKHILCYNALDMIRMKCLLCGDNGQPKELYPPTYTEKAFNRRIFSARRLPDRIHYRIVRCQRCGQVYSDPIMPPSRIASLYRESVCNYDTQLSYITRTYVDLFRKFVRIKNPAVLEVGCGNGFFLSAIKAQGITDDVYGVEPGSEMVNSAPKWLKKRITVDLFKKGQFPEGKFDAVCCFHTLDHMTDPAVFMRESYRVLAPGGRIVIVVHDAEGISVRLFGERSPIFDVEHIYLFSKKTLPQLAQKHGFATEAVADLVNSYPLSYWVRMAGIPKQVKLPLLRLFDTARVGKITVSLAGGNMYMVAGKTVKLSQKSKVKSQKAKGIRHKTKVKSQKA